MIVRKTDFSLTYLLFSAPGTTETTTGPSNTVRTFTAKQSGAFDDIATWTSGVVPSGKCSIDIPTGFTVTFTGTLLDVEITTLTISGTFTIVSTGGIGFGLSFPINILIKSGGSLTDKTDNNRLYVRADSVFTFLSGASFTGSNTQVFTFTGATPGSGAGTSITFGSSITGPFTFGASVDGTTRRFNSVMCLSRQSGGFRTGSTWLGGVAPTVDFCGSAKGCDLFLPGGFTLSTDDLNGELDIQFNTIEIAAEATFALGSAGSSAGFRFKFKATLNANGTIEDTTGGTGGILIPFGSNFNLFGGAKFVSSVSTFLRVFDPTTGATVGDGLSLSGSLSIPFFVGVSSTGQVSTSSTSKLLLSHFDDVKFLSKHFSAPGTSETTTTPSNTITTFTAKQSGAFDDVATWASGVVPSGRCSIEIPTGFTVTFTGTLLDVEIKTLTISGTFTIVSSEGIGFGFTSPINILIKTGGSLTDKTDNNRLYVRADSVFTFLSGASFTGSNTQVFTFTGATPGSGAGTSITFGSSITGPFTFGASVDGTTRRFNSVMCLSRQSGGFRTGSTWLGGVAPTVDFCGSAKGCDLFLPGGFTLSTDDLNGELDIQFNTIDISADATFKLGSAGSSAGFRFKFKTTLNANGTIEDTTGGTGGILVPFGSNFNLFGGAKFVSSVSTFLRVFDPTTGATVGDGLSLSGSLSIPFFVGVSSTGQVATSSTSKVI